jgi:hypothetical protein
MTGQITIAAAASIGTIAIHALVMTVVIRAARAMGGPSAQNQSLFLTGVMVVVVTILMSAHTIEVLLWALVYAILEIAPAGTNYVYFAFVNYTTLGYGDVVPNPQWRLLGPVTAMNGVLMFGWSTAVIFEVLRKALLNAEPQP